MSTKQLTARQARWAEALSDYYFEIMYRDGKKNQKADALTRRDEEVEAQDGVKAEYRTRAFLSQDQVDPQVLRDLGINALDTNTVEMSTLDEPLQLIDRLLQANRDAPSLDALRTEASSEEPGELTIEEGLLLYSGRLVVPKGDVVITDLIKEAHS
jgi:hypothetical protein